MLYIKIIMTGGGTSGHITPNIALFEPLKKCGFDISYIGTKEGLEYNLIKQKNIPFYPIKAGKLRRYIDMQNIKDISKIFKGYHESRKILKNIRPDVIFSKGGFVSCPVVWAAKTLGIPVVIHESDITPGLANKIAIPFAQKICYAFPETKANLPQNKSIYTGLPVRQELFDGNREKGLEYCGFSGKKPMLTIIGGSLGSAFVNQTIRTNLDTLLSYFDICHICGKGNIDSHLLNIDGYCQFEYVNEQLRDIMAATDMFVSRAGATVIFEILALKKPALLVPLSKKASRGDQIDNAKSFAKQGYVEYICEEDINQKDFVNNIIKIYEEKEKYISSQAKFDATKSVNAVVNVIQSVLKGRI